MGGACLRPCLQQPLTSLKTGGDAHTHTHTHRGRQAGKVAERERERERERSKEESDQRVLRYVSIMDDIAFCLYATEPLSLEIHVLLSAKSLCATGSGLCRRSGCSAWIGAGGGGQRQRRSRGVGGSFATAGRNARSGGLQYIPWWKGWDAPPRPEEATAWPCAQPGGRGP